MMNIFGIFFLSFLSLRKTIITVKFATIPIDAITVDTIMTMSSIIEDPFIESVVDISVALEIFSKELGVEMMSGISKHRIRE